MRERGTTHRSRKKGSATHNPHKFKAKHIDSTKTPDNVLWCCYPGMDFDKAELMFYGENFHGQIESTNGKARKSRHKERITSPEKLLEQENTRPEEVIYQIGNKDQHASATVLQAVYSDFRIWHNVRFGDHVKILNFAIHVDETTPHVHERDVWVYHHKDGYEAIGQHKALEQLGYTLPDPDKPRSRTNNLKIPYTAECREKWIDICREHGIEIETQPIHRAPNEQNLDKGDFVIMQQDKAIQKVSENLESLKKDLEDKKHTADVLESKIAFKRVQNEKLTTINKSISKALNSQENSIHINGKTLDMKMLAFIFENMTDGQTWVDTLSKLQTWGRQRIHELSGFQEPSTYDKHEDDDWADKL